METTPESLAPQGLLGVFHILRVEVYSLYMIQFYTAKELLTF